MKTYTILMISEYGTVYEHEEVQNNSLPRVIALAHSLADVYSQRLEAGENASIFIFPCAAIDCRWGAECWSESIINPNNDTQ